MAHQPQSSPGIPIQLPQAIQTTASTSLTPIQFTQHPTMTTQTQTQGSSTTQQPSSTAPTATATTITNAFDKALKRTPIGGGGSGGGGGGGGGSRGGGGGGGANPPALQPIAQANDVRAMDKLPEAFTGDRTKADDFIEEVKGYLRLNADVPGFNSPMKKIAFTLTHMKGPDVAGWTRDMGILLDALDPVADNVPLLWEQFLFEFKAQYLDSAREDRARTALANHTMKNGDIDSYISMFEELAGRAGYTTGNPETTRFFMQGLLESVVQDCLHSPQVHGYVAIKQRAIESTAAQRIIRDMFGGKNTTQEGQRKPWTQSNNRGARPFYFDKMRQQELVMCGPGSAQKPGPHITSSCCLILSK